MGDAISFRPLAAADLPQLAEWFNRPHVYEWWGVDAASDGVGGPGEKAATLDQVREHYGPDRHVDREVSHFVILLGDRPVGLIQWYPVDAYPEYAGAVGEPGAAAIDLLIGETDCVDRGVGPEVIRGFTTDVVLPGSGADRVIASPRVDNGRSIGAFEKAGFRGLRDVHVPGEPVPERIMAFDRHR